MYLHLYRDTVRSPESFSRCTNGVERALDDLTVGRGPVVNNDPLTRSTSPQELGTPRSRRSDRNGHGSGVWCPRRPSHSRREFLSPRPRSRRTHPYHRKTRSHTGRPLIYESVPPKRRTFTVDLPSTSPDPSRGSSRTGVRVRVEVKGRSDSVLS